MHTYEGAIGELKDTCMSYEEEDTYERAIGELKHRRRQSVVVRKV